ncbi:hypothetical protein BDV95DRAFT_494455 [Massariosphaeria phaeospora]|uniref:Integral membrane protein n=1 Tax=Massariosphaeria phaeospora TaxID=100035 RepID=A0A7C8I501_9PLEO|nr:hypothetical protein BDV95DRAFT_494455 [Massariosphaeria phaeospora]
MKTERAFSLATIVLLLEVLPLVAAHGEEHNDNPMDMSVHGVAQPQVDQNAFPQSYWRISEHATLMYWHIALEVLAWVVILPIGVMLSIAHSRFMLPTQFVFVVINAATLLLGVVFDRKTPELYENNAHSKTGWIITWIASAWVLMALIQVYAGRSKVHSLRSLPAQPVTAANIDRHQRVQDAQLSKPPRWSNDSGQGTERNSESLFGNSCRSPSEDSEDQQFAGPTRRYAYDEDDDAFGDEAEKRGFLRNSSTDGCLPRNIARLAVGRPLKVLRLVYVVFERTLIVQGFVAIASGTVVYGGIGHGGAIFNVLAHYVKGGIFFGYGLLTLGRWMGAFADLGWAWNVKPPKEVVGRRRAVVPSAEFTESFVIFLYGCTNVFLEHLAAWGGAWTPQDLEHVSISVMFFGGGLLGMIIESNYLRELLNTGVLSERIPLQNEGSWHQPRQYRFSMNPMPGLIILLLGKMMSSHHQASKLSTMIHSQWGGMFMGFALARAVTYITLYVSPPTSFLPSRPPSEVIAAFCLIAGGLTFVVSNKDTVAVLEFYDLDAMFTFTVTMGLTALIMAWTTVLIAFKGWTVRKETTVHSAKRNNGVIA